MKTIKMCRRSAEELQHKIMVAEATEDLMADYGYTEAELAAFRSRVRVSIGDRNTASLEVDARDLRFVSGEMENAADIAEANIPCGGETGKQARIDARVFRKISRNAAALLE